ncbi:MAG: peptide-methionine (S)-S-oxide reductase MsrA [Candidatus Azotimanducaceae bacterium]|uniref:Peptide methionine sulfoxide reductase MsrA n=1 Tax=OM182 bacterium TaxID=2510334 RepID=A0A520S4S1_9GAMM|nr:peptide-methionine (S)-S-oxide reductase [Gammaproteobacteria bacterium]OUV68300.1 MAG: peptide-methionine (S)-S-oxide reductase [Gammaproteobacteria bacterium TMED133]RZO77473.1 MAG: peptide-methionine (S)-S-oxide reductase MsrA [OM182 bacterium]
MKLSRKLKLPNKDTALPGRNDEMVVPNYHFVNGNPMKPPFPGDLQKIVFGMGCFWGAERIFWEQHGVYVTAAGYAGGITPNPSYEEVCSGLTGHNEVVLVVFNERYIKLDTLLSIFWESHDPTQGMRQGNDIGTQYRSGIYTYSQEQKILAEGSLETFQSNLSTKGYPTITTEIFTDSSFYYAEHYHQQYLAKVPNGYCGLGGTGVKYCAEIN